MRCPPTTVCASVFRTLPWALIPPRIVNRPHGKSACQEDVLRPGSRSVSDINKCRSADTNAVVEQDIIESRSAFEIQPVANIERSIVIEHVGHTFRSGIPGQVVANGEHSVVFKIVDATHDQVVTNRDVIAAVINLVDALAKRNQGIFADGQIVVRRQIDVLVTIVGKHPQVSTDGIVIASEFDSSIAGEEIEQHVPGKGIVKVDVDIAAAAVKQIQSHVIGWR